APRTVRFHYGVAPNVVANRLEQLALLALQGLVVHVCLRGARLRAGPHVRKLLHETGGHVQGESIVTAKEEHAFSTCIPAGAALCLHGLRQATRPHALDRPEVSLVCRNLAATVRRRLAIR